MLARALGLSRLHMRVPARRFVNSVEEAPKRKQMPLDIRPEIPEPPVVTAVKNTSYLVVGLAAIGLTGMVGYAIVQPFFDR
jgi:hypothetical protein